MQKLPIGIQDFRTIRENDYLYIDKTQYYYELMSSKYYFLSRPRRFGKSLLLSTLKEIFSGNKELFSGLWIEDKIEWTQYPVILIDFNVITHDRGIEEFDSTLGQTLLAIANTYGVMLENNTPKAMFKELIIELSRINRVVLLIDEYDKPINDYMHDLEKANRNRQYLASFYEVIKSMDAYLQFVLLTGVTKFNKVSIFSKLNNLLDITLSDRFAGMLGITEEELYHYFDDYLPATKDKLGFDTEKLKTEIRTMYNGYSWDGETYLYNPFSILNFFYEKKFSNYWFETGTPTFLIEQIKKFTPDLTDFENLEIGSYGLSSYDAEHIEIIPLMFQTGYLTIKATRMGFLNETIYRLSIPNYEVKYSLLNHIVGAYTQLGMSRAKPPYMRMVEELYREHIEQFILLLQSAFAALPYTLYPKREDYYHSIFYLMLALLGAQIDVEVLTDKGRIDGVVEFDDKIYVIEFKTGKAETGMRQIKERRYWERFQIKNKKIILLAVGNFDEKEIEYMCEEWK